MCRRIETLRVVHFDAGRTVLAVSEYSSDLPDRVALSFRSVIADALRLRSAGLILSHNHPGGDPTPSSADRRVTDALVRVAQPLGIRIHDHLIYGSGACVSFRALGLL